MRALLDESTSRRALIWGWTHPPLPYADHQRSGSKPAKVNGDFALDETACVNETVIGRVEEHNLDEDVFDFQFVQKTRFLRRSRELVDVLVPQLLDVVAAEVGYFKSKTSESAHIICFFWFSNS